MKIQIEMLTTKPAHQVRKANALTIGKVAKGKTMRIIKESSLSHMEKHDTGLISASRNMFSSYKNTN